MRRPSLELADIFRQHGPAYRASHRLPLPHLRVMRAIETCRTAALGGHVESCGHCAHQRIAYNSCLMGSNLLWGVESSQGHGGAACMPFELPIKTCLQHGDQLVRRTE